MRAFAWLIPVVGLLSLGCGSNPETGRKTKSIATEETTAFPKAESPAVSDPASRDIAAKIIAAHTGNDPAMLAKMKSMTFGRVGKHLETQSPFSFRISAVWPDRARYVWSGLEAIPFTIRLVENQAFRDDTTPARTLAVPEKLFDGFFRHLYSDWLQLLVPLGEVDTIVAPGPDHQQLEKKYPSIRVWRTGKPQAMIYYDPTTFRMVRLAFDGLENMIPTYIELVFSDYQPTSGFLLAHHVFIRMNGREVMEFDQATLEFPKDHALKLFTEP